MWSFNASFITRSTLALLLFIVDRCRQIKYLTPFSGGVTHHQIYFFKSLIKLNWAFYWACSIIKSVKWFLIYYYYQTHLARAFVLPPARDVVFANKIFINFLLSPKSLKIDLWFFRLPTVILQSSRKKIRRQNLSIKLKLWPRRFLLFFGHLRFGATIQRRKFWSTFTDEWTNKKKKKRFLANLQLLSAEKENFAST